MHILGIISSFPCRSGAYKNLPSIMSQLQLAAVGVQLHRSMTEANVASVPRRGYPRVERAPFGRQGKAYCRVVPVSMGLCIGRDRGRVPVICACTPKLSDDMLFCSVLHETSQDTSPTTS